MDDDGAGDARCTLTCQWARSTDVDAWSITVTSDAAAEEDGIIPKELFCVLGRVIVQSAATHIAASKSNEEEATLLRITLPLLEGEGCQKLLLSDLFPADDRGGTNGPNDAGVRLLFTPLNEQYAEMEIVDMVNQEGEVLGSLPRPYIHSWNILHRGIGMIVSKDVNILEGLEMGNAPEVYVHQRTSTKRIFPSLFDMFVGGVSSSGEDSSWTAAREVAEELGLKRALDVLQSNNEENQINPLSDKLFQCTVCTSYNRCAVSMFTYTCDTSLEAITLQEEEVAWGNYVPYNVVELAAKMSIQRLVEKGSWPGSTCDNNEDANVSGYDNGEKIESNGNDEMSSNYGSEEPWVAWDFVPDGLLVWEAWRKFTSLNS